MLNEKMMHTGHKLLFLAKGYPEKNLDAIMKLFPMTAPIDMDTAIWGLMDNGMIVITTRQEEVEVIDPRTGMPVVDPKTQKPTGEKRVSEVEYIKIIREPDEWDFGTEEKELEDAILYMFNKVNASEADVEEWYLTGKLAGYPPQDCLIAVRHMLEDNVLHEYEIEDGENKYLFYTLKANAGKNWGQKQFKTNPLTGKDQTANEDSDTAEDS